MTTRPGRLIIVTGLLPLEFEQHNERMTVKPLATSNLPSPPSFAKGIRMTGLYSRTLAGREPHYASRRIGHRNLSRSPETTVHAIRSFCRQNISKSF